MTARQKRVLRELVKDLPRFDLEIERDGGGSVSEAWMMCSLRGEFVRVEDVLDAIRSSHSNE